MYHIYEEELKTINWLSADQRVQRSLNAKAFKYVLNTYPCYIRQKSLLYTGPSFWEKLPNSMKKNVSLNTFKHDLKRQFLQELRM